MGNPYVFIVGCPRSGTTLLQRMVDAHPQVAVIFETKWIPRLFDKRKGLTREGLVTPELIPLLLVQRDFDRLHIDREQLEGLLEAERPTAYANFVSRIFDLYGQRRGKLLVGDKTPSYVRELDTLHTLWPRARFVHLIRDGRDVYLSTAGWPKGKQKRPAIFDAWKDDAVSTAAFWWEMNVRLGREAGNSLGPELYYEMRYESLVRNPAEECAGLCAFLGLPYDDAMLRFYEGRTKTDPALDAKRAWRSITPGLRDWRSQMTAEDVERFEAAAGELLDELGYPRAVPRPRPEALEHASKIRELLAQDANWKQLAARPRAESLEIAPRPPDLRVEDRGDSGWSEGRS
jgi:hypothetical protein